MRRVQLNLVSVFVMWTGLAGEHGECSGMIGMRSNAVHVLAVVPFVCACSIDELLYHVVSAGITDACFKMSFVDGVQAELRTQRSDEFYSISCYPDLEPYFFAGSNKAMHRSSYGIRGSCCISGYASIEKVGSFAVFFFKSSCISIDC